MRQGGRPTWSGNGKASPQSSSTHSSSLFILLPVSSVSLKFWKTNKSNEARDVGGQRIKGHPGLASFQVTHPAMTLADIVWKISHTSVPVCLNGGWRGGRRDFVCVYVCTCMCVKSIQQHYIYHLSIQYSA